MVVAGAIATRQGLMKTPSPRQRLFEVHCASREEACGDSCRRRPSRRNAEL